MRQMHRGFQVRQYKPWKLWLALALVLLLFWLFFQLGNGYQSYQLIRLNLERETMLSRINELEARNHSLVQKNAQLQGTSRIEHDAYQRANQTMVELQQVILSQKEELIFYQGIVSPENAALGVNLQSFEVKARSNPNLYGYKLVLTKQGKISQKLKGAVVITLRGEVNGEVSELKLSKLRLENPGKATNFSFRYFQVFEGDFELPEGFSPYEVEIGIKASSKKVKSYSETVSWAELISEDY
jgi:cell division protein FtsB